MSVDAAPFHRDLVPFALLRLASDERLVESVRAGSERAFEALFDRHHRAVLAFCRHMLGSAADAEDAVQHTFLAAYSDLIRSEKPIALRPWLYAIARHRCLSVLRARRERPSAELPDRGVDNLAAEVDAREAVRATFTDLTRLPDDQRAALILAELGDVSHEEIARILGCPRDKVKALVFQARTSLTADRAARETPCADIRAQLTSVGGALRHTNLRRHVRECPGCRAFRHELRSVRRGFGLLLPVAGLKRTVLSALSGSGGAGAGGVALTAGAVGGGGLAATAMVVAAVAAVGAPEPSAQTGSGGTLLPAVHRQPSDRAGAGSASGYEPSALVIAGGGLPAGLRDFGGLDGVEVALLDEAGDRLAPAEVNPAVHGPATHAGPDGAQSGAPATSEPTGGDEADGRGAPVVPLGPARRRGDGKPTDLAAGYRRREPANPRREPQTGQANRPAELPGRAKPPAELPAHGKQPARLHDEPVPPGKADGPARPSDPGGSTKPAEPAKPPHDSGKAGPEKPSAGPPPEAAAAAEHGVPPESARTGGIGLRRDG